MIASKAAHTPGPWELIERPWDIDMPAVIESTRTEIGGHRYVARAERIEDARLITAAPELLEALIEIRAEMGSTPDVARINAMIALADAAIEKATG